MEESSNVPLGNEAVIMSSRGSHTPLRIGKSTSLCIGSRRRKGQPVKRKILEYDEEPCNSTIGDSEEHSDRVSSAISSVLSTVDIQKSKCDSSFWSQSSSFSSDYNPTSDSLQTFEIEPATFAVNPSTIMVDSSNIVVSPRCSETSNATEVQGSLHNRGSEDSPPDPLPSATNPHSFFGGAINQSTDGKNVDEMELLRRLIVLVGSGYYGGQAAALQVLSANPPLTLPASSYFTDQYRCGASTALPFSESQQNQTVFTSLLNNTPANESGTSGVSSNTCPPNVSWSQTDYSSNNALSEAHSMLSSFISKLVVDSTNSAVPVAMEAKCKGSNDNIGSTSLSPPQSSKKADLQSPSIAFDAVVVTRRQNSTEVTPDKLLGTAEEQPDICIRSSSKIVSKQIGEDGKNGVLNPLLLTARQVNQWNRSDMDAVLNSPIFRAFPRLSFRPHIKRKLFGDFSASTSNMQNSSPEIDDLEGFAQHFKKQRIKLGYTQGDVGLALGRKYGTDFSQTTISRFEAMNLSFKNMCKLRPLLKEWLECQEAAVANGANVEELRSIEISKDNMEDCVDELPIHRPASAEPLMKRRRKRTNLDLSQRKSLDNFFLANPRPGHEEMVRIANALDLERDVVRVWFCNRRQKLRRSEDVFPMIHSPCRTRVKKSYPIGLPKEMNDGNLTLETAETTTNLY